ncbi:MAG: transcriptional repressor [Chloroflexi bacterium]|nr:transcriptional repressor [Chloroflexota bacterium]
MEEAMTILHQKGNRITPQRVMIIEAVLKGDGHLTAEGIYRRVSARYPQVDISTIYRTLILLKEASLVTETDLGGGRMEYHWRKKSHHHHLVCEGCGQVLNLGEEEVQLLHDRLLEKYDFEASLTHLAIFGRCAKCR